MDWIINSQDFMAILSVPIAIITAINLLKNWRSVFDANLTQDDRSLLLRVALFLIMPAIVFLHECGHAAATLYFGGQIEKFHYGFLWGYVIPRGDFTQLQLLIIYLAGNVVEIALGLLAFIIAVISSSPPVVALGVYVAFWAVGGTLIFYTLLSVMGAYGDWIAIYSSPERTLVDIIGILHAFVVGVIIWLAYAEKPMLWFARKTNPQMVPQEHELLKQNKLIPTMDAYVGLAWIYYQYGVFKQAWKYIHFIDKTAPKEPKHNLLKGYLYQDSGKIDKAREAFFESSKSTYSDDMMRARALMALGNLEQKIVEVSLRGAPSKPHMWKAAVDAYSAACAAKPDLGDPHYYRGVLYARQGLDNWAEEELLTVSQLQCLDTNLFGLAQAELVRLKALQVPSQ